MVASSTFVGASNGADPAVADSPPEQTVSPARLRANQANARKSTGPRTPEGKARSSQNALVHGLRAASILGPDEDPRQLADYRISILRATNPRNALEMEYVEQIIRAGWKLRRYQAAEVKCLQPSGSQNPPNNAAEELNSLLFGHKPYFVNLFRYEQEYVRMMNRAVQELRKLKQDPIEGTLCDFAGEMIEQEASALADPDPRESSAAPRQGEPIAPNEPNRPPAGLSHGLEKTYDMPPGPDKLIESLDAALRILGHPPDRDRPPRSRGS